MFVSCIISPSYQSEVEKQRERESEEKKVINVHSNAQFDKPVRLFFFFCIEKKGGGKKKKHNKT